MTVLSGFKRNVWSAWSWLNSRCQETTPRPVRNRSACIPSLATCTAPDLALARLTPCPSTGCTPATGAPHPVLRNGTTSLQDHLGPREPFSFSNPATQNLSP